MRIELGMCQLRPVMGSPETNARKILEILEEGVADVYAFPELYLTGYGSDCSEMEYETERCVGMISDACRSVDSAVALGTPWFEDGVMYNSMAFLSPDGDVVYHKSHLARVGVYSEEGFGQGSEPVTGWFRGIGFGLCVCYDIFFPEILHGCSLNGASVNICCAASAMQSKPFLDTVLPARALENVSYMVYMNNTGRFGDLVMHGCSRCLDPFGRTMSDCGTGECIRTATIDTENLAESRSIRHHLDDFRTDVQWLGKRF